MPIPALALALALALAWELGLGLGQVLAPVVWARVLAPAVVVAQAERAAQAIDTDAA